MSERVSGRKKLAYPNRLRLNHTAVLTAVFLLLVTAIPLAVAAASTFTSVAVGAQTPSTLFYGTGGDVTFTITVNRINNGNLDVDLSISPLSPAGASTTISPATVSFTGNTPTSLTSTLTIHTTASTPAGSYGFIITGIGNGNEQNHVKTAGGTLTITKKPASVTPDVKTKIYGDVDPTLTGTLSGFLGGDGVTATYSRTAGETVAGSPYTISATLSAPGENLDNYDITYNTAAFTITTKAASVTANSASKTYGDPDPIQIEPCILTGFLPGDGVYATYSRTPGETVAGSPYTTSCQLFPPEVLGNYNIMELTGLFTITKKGASVTPNAASKTNGDPDPVFTGTLSGFLPGDHVTATYSRTLGETAGNYIISATLLPVDVLGNYDIIYNTAPFTISGQPPDCDDAVPSTACFWPPNHKFEDVTVNGVTDANTITIGTIFSDEKTCTESGAGGAKCPDANVFGSLAQLRSERSGNSDGRVYKIQFTAENGDGSCSGFVKVCIPHDQSGKCKIDKKTTPAGATVLQVNSKCCCIDEGDLYNALAYS